MTNIPNITIGADPEFFVVEARDGTAWSAVDLVPGSKREPFAVTGGAVQVDGLALEINVNPSSTRQEFMGNIATVMHDIEAFLPPHLKIAHGLPYLEFPQNVLDMQPPHALELGCEPDYNAYTGLPNPRPNGTVNFRTAAGHIHIGWEAGVADPYGDKSHFRMCCELVKQLDYYVGLYALKWDPDNRRRSLYGAAGAFRAKSYGLEYRTPSTAWLASEHLQAWIFDAAMKATVDYFKGDLATDKYGETLAQQIIDNNITNWAQQGFGIELGLLEPYVAEAA
jgi:hypothetical protein